MCQEVTITITMIRRSKTCTVEELADDDIDGDDNDNNNHDDDDDDDKN